MATLHIFSNHEWENLIEYKIFALKTTSENFSISVQKADEIIIGITKRNYFKLPEILNWILGLKNDAESMKEENFEQVPLFNLEKRFTAHLESLESWLNSKNSKIKFQLFEPILIEYLKYIESISFSFADKELLMAMGLVSNTAFTGPYSLKIDYTTFCSDIYCRCFDKYLSGKKCKESMDLSKLTGIIKEAKYMDVQRLIFEGCIEPLTISFFEKLIQILTVNYIPAELTTNGILMNQNKAGLIIRSHIFYDLKVNLSATNSKTYENVNPKSGGYFKRIVENCKYFSQLKRKLKVEQPTFTMIFDMNRANFEYIEEAVDFAADLGFNSIIFRLPDFDSTPKFKHFLPDQLLLLDKKLEVAKKSAEENKIKFIINNFSTILLNQRLFPSEKSKIKGCFVGWYNANVDYEEGFYFCSHKMKIGEHSCEKLKESWFSNKTNFKRLYLRSNSKITTVNDTEKFFSGKSCLRCLEKEEDLKVKKIVTETGLSKFLLLKTDDFFKIKPFLLIKQFEILNKIACPDTRTTIFYNKPVIIKLKYYLPEKEKNIFGQISFSTKVLKKPYTISTLTVLLSGENKTKKFRTIYFKIKNLKLLDDLKIEMDFRALYKEKDLELEFDRILGKHHLTILNPKEVGGGLVGIKHFMSITHTKDPYYNYRNSFRIGTKSFKLDDFPELFLFSNFSILDQSGKVAEKIEQNSAYRFQFIFNFLFPVNKIIAKPVFRIQFVKFDEELEKLFIFGTNNYRHNIYPEKIFGEVKFEIDFPRLELPAGKYELIFSILENDKPEAQQYFHKIFDLNISADSENKFPQGSIELINYADIKYFSKIFKTLNNLLQE